MAAYAALLSVMQIIDQLQHHSRPPISIEEKQVESLTKNLSFLQEFLEGYTPIGENEGDGLESRILDAANEAADVIESHIVDRIHSGSTSQHDHVEFGQLLQRVIEDMDLIKDEVTEAKEKMGAHHEMEMQEQNISSASSSGAAQNPYTTMVDFDDALYEILDKLTGELDHQVIPIVGMVGIGKTTLARNVYEHPLIKSHFDILAWARISQKCDTRKILNEILSQAMKDEGNSSERNEKQIRNDLFQYLFGRRYLIVIDDMWSTDAWDKIKHFFPNRYNGSRIVVTTRISNLASQLSDSYALRMKFLDMDKSWDLFSKIVFTREEDYPPEMVEIGRKIVEKCRGLLLSIVVVGVFLAKSDYKREHWEHIEESLSSFVNSANDEHCLKILQLSYDQLPVWLRPCFLYMGVFKEGTEIRISKLVKLWVAEGFLRPISGKDLEEVGKEYLNDLADRNLILMAKSKEKCVKIHDLLRDLCLRQSREERFYSVVTQHSVSIPFEQRRFVITEEVRDATVLSMPLARSMICNFKGVHPLPHLKLLRILEACDDSLIIDDYFSQENKLQLVNLRYLFARCPWDSKFATSFHLLWSLQTLIIQGNIVGGFRAPAEIWNMPQLRHVQVRPCLDIPYPPICTGQEDFVLEKLQTLMTVRNFKCDEGAVKRIPNIKKLHLEYNEEGEESCLDNLDRLHKLTSFYCSSYPFGDPDRIGFMQKLSFPSSLKKLTLNASYIHWEDLLEKIGSLPLLQKLTVGGGYFTTHVWETVEDQFPNLRFLEMNNCAGLEHWDSERSHFPRLEHIVLRALTELNEIPLDIGEISSLQSIKLYHCSNSAAISCKRILDEQEELHGKEEVGLRVRVQHSYGEYEALKELVSPNFELIK